jgi:flagellar operon protein (TIGR03826 family)
MSLINCPECGKLFEKKARNLCPDCIEKEEQDFKLIKDYLYKNPGEGIIAVSEQTGVSDKKIIAFLKEGRLFVDASYLNCEHCGKPISSGRYCNKCFVSLSKKLSQTTGAAESPKITNDVTKKGKKHMFSDFQY